MSSEDVVRFYWSFRSPYAWFAVHRVEDVLADLPVELDWIPVFPPPDPAAMVNNPTNVPAKIRYIWEDSMRFADAYGLEFRRPEKIDTEWAKPHIAFLHAESQGCGPEFAREAFAARFTRGEDLGENAVLAAIAQRVGLEADEVTSAAEDPGLRKRLGDGFRALRADEVFGVPTFIYRGEMFFGNDRLEWLVRAIERTASP